MTQPRYKYHSRVFLDHYGQGPWPCESCGVLVYKFGKHEGEGAIHHKDEDKLNNDPRNLALLHFSCHRRLHMVGTTQSEATRDKIRKANTGHKVSPSTRKKIGDANRGNKSSVGRVASNETRKKLSESAKALAARRKEIDQITCECGRTMRQIGMLSHAKATGHVQR